MRDRPRPGTLTIGAAVLAAGAAAHADVTTYQDEAEYLAALAALGFGTLVEDFEGADWDAYRTTNPFEPVAAASISSQGLTWSGNDLVTTNMNWARDGWGIFTTITGPWTVDTLTVDSEQPLLGVGGWYDSNPDFAADIAYVIDGVVVPAGSTGAGHVFLGVIDPCGFTTVDIIDTHKAAAWGADDFTFATGPIVDCNGNGRSDACDVAGGASTDCDGNGVPDECDGTADCNGNGVFDACDVVDVQVHASGMLSPVSSGVPRSLTIAAPEPAVAPVRLDFTAYAHLGGSNAIVVDVNGVGVGTVFDSGGTDCPEGELDQAILLVDAVTFNGAVGGGDAVITLTPTEEVAAGECDGTTFVTVTVGLPVPSALDADGNGVVDACESIPGDANDDGFVDVDDVVTVILNWGPCPAPPAPCVGDEDGDGVVGIDDVIVVILNWS